MKKNCLYILFFTLITSFCFTAQLSGDTIRVGSAVQEGDIYVSEPFQYQIIIDGYDNEGTADINPLQPWSPQSIGGRNVSQTSITIINGRQSQSITKRYVMAYQLVATEAGVNRLPGVTVEVKGQSYQTNPVEVNILQPQTTNKIHLEMVLSETDCYAGQPVTLMVNWYIQNDIVRNVKNFLFVVPALLQDAFIIEDAPPEQVSQDKLLEVSVNNESTIATQDPVSYKGQNCVKVSFEKILIPRNEGTIQIPATSLSCEIAVGRSSRSRDPFDSFFSRQTYKRFQASSEPAVLVVRPLPTEGRPSDFSGLVGRYSIQSQAQPANVNVGDPITLTIRISGDLLKMVEMPNLESIPYLAKNFKIPTEQATPKIEGNRKIFTQTIRANNADVTEIPGIPLSYFDADEGKYVTVYSDPIPLEVTETKIVTAAQAEGVSLNPQKRELEAVQQGIAANYEGPLLLVNASFSPMTALTQPVYLVLLIVPPTLFFILCLVRFAQRSDPERQRAKRQAGAYDRAIKKLGLLKSGHDLDTKDYKSKLAEILRQYIGDRYNRTASSLTTQDCKNILLENQQEQNFVESFCQILQDCEKSRFAANAGNSNFIDLDQIKNILKTIDKNK